jgi:hypothetical protein
LYLEPLLLASMVPAAAATWSQSSRLARFGLGFYTLFSSLTIYDIGEVASALVYLIALGVVFAAMVAYLEVKIGSRPSTCNCKGRSLLAFVLVAAAAFLTSYLIFRQLIYAVPISVACMATLTIQRENLCNMLIRMSIIESALLVVFAGVGWFTSVTSIPLCLLMLTSSLGIPYLLFSRGNLLRPVKST